MKVQKAYFQEYREPLISGPGAQYTPQAADLVAIPATLAASGGGATWNSGPVITDGFRFISVSAKTSRAGTLTIQRYLDEACTIPIGAPITATLVANTQNFVSSTDQVPYAAFTIAIANTDGAGASVISNFGCLLQAG